MDNSLDPIKGAHEIYTYVRDLRYPEDLVVWLEIDGYKDERVYNGVYQISDGELTEKIRGEAVNMLKMDI